MAQLLPDDLKELSERNGLDVRHASFHADMDKLVKGLRRTKAEPPVKPSPAKLVVPPSPVVLHLPAMPSIDEVIAANGQWVKDFKINSEAAVAPDIFKHLFLKVNSVPTAGSTAGSIFVGREWIPTAIPKWTIVHGYTDSTGWALCSLMFLTYLGPTWRPEYAQLSDAAFKKLGGKPLKPFIRHP